MPWRCRILPRLMVPVRLVWAWGTPAVLSPVLWLPQGLWLSLLLYWLPCCGAPGRLVWAWGTPAMLSPALWLPCGAGGMTAGLVRAWLPPVMWLLVWGMPAMLLLSGGVAVVVCR